MSDLSKIIAKAKGLANAEVVSKGKESTIELDKIQNRADDTRPLNQSHIEKLAESIAILGLIEPLVIDQENTLLAGGHRKAAIAHLRETNHEAYQEHFRDDLVNVAVQPFKASEEPERALEIEISENEARRDYTREEVQAIAKRLKAAGYKMTPGRPRKGEKRLKPALMTIFGKSIATVERYLGESKTPSSDEVSKEDKLLKKAIAALEQWKPSEKRRAGEVALYDHIGDMLKLLKAALENEY